MPTYFVKLKAHQPKFGTAIIEADDVVSQALPAVYKARRRPARARKLAAAARGRSRASNPLQRGLCRRENMNLKFLSTQMGTSVAMIDKHYGHVEVSEIGGEIAKKSVGKMSA